MPHVAIQKIANIEDRSLPIFQETEQLLSRIRQRAFDLSIARGRRWASALQDWLDAERELSWQTAELAEREKDFVLSFALPGFDPAQVSVTATPRELIVHAKAQAAAESKPGEKIVWSSLRTNDVYRQIELPGEIDIEKVSASLSNGLLKVVAAKLERAEKSARTVRIT